MMQHRHVAGEPIEIREFADFKLEKARRESIVVINEAFMATRIMAEDAAREGFPVAWICLAVRDRTELHVEKSMDAAGIEVFVGKRLGARVVKRGRIREGVMLPEIPGYVLVRCALVPGAMMALRRFDGVTGIVGGPERPHRIRDKYVVDYKDKLASGAYDHREVRTVYMVGERVRVTDGPFASFPGVVVAVDEAGKSPRMSVEVNIFGRPTPVELDIAQLEKM